MGKARPREVHGFRTSLRACVQDQRPAVFLIEEKALLWDSSLSVHELHGSGVEVAAAGRLDEAELSALS